MTARKPAHSETTTRITEILEAQQVEVTEISNERCEYRILGIATTAAKIMEAAKDAGFFWAYGDARCDSCDNGIMPDWKWCPYCAAPQSSNDAEFGTGDFRRPDAPVKSDASLSEALTEIRAGLAGIPFDSDAQISDAAPAREPSATISLVLPHPRPRRCARVRDIRSRAEDGR